MRRGRTLIFIILIIIIGMVVAFVAFNQVAGPTQPQQPVFVEIYIAAQNIPQGGEIKAELLTTIKIAPENLVAVMYTVDEQAKLLGKVAKFPLDQGVVITESMVSDGSTAVPISGPQWASLIPPGMIAVSVPIDRLGLAGYAVNSGAHVNINACLLFVDIDPSFQSETPNQTALVTGTGILVSTGLPVLSLGITAAGNSAQGRLELDPSLQQPYYLVPSQAQRPRMVCQMLLQDVVVMRVGDFPLDATTSLTGTPATAPADAAAQPITPSSTPDIVTFIVSPQDSITLSYLMHTDADLSLTLRNPSDQLRQATEASTLQFLLSQYNIPVPAKLPYSLEPYTTSFGNLTLGVPNNIIPPTKVP